jgi:transposase InsO family protein
MPWQEVSVMQQRQEFVRLAMQEGANRRELCRRFDISPQIGYKWLNRCAAGGVAVLKDRSRRPQVSPSQTSPETEALVLRIRDVNPAWGARKIAHCLKRDGHAAPAASTVHAILVRNGRVVHPARTPGQPWQRFEKETPNQLWQMDFKGWVPLTDGTRCHPLTVVDDHSRYALCLEVCADQQGKTVRERLEKIFRCYGLPDSFFVDNGTPWGDSGGERWTRFGVWLLKLGVGLIHSRPYYPQSRGKNERFHRTLNAEVLALRRFRAVHDMQRAFDEWRNVYNLERPHEALDQDVPASRYRQSSRSMPDHLPDIEYDDPIVRVVPATKDYVAFKGSRWLVPRAFRGERVAIRPLNTDGNYGVFFGAYQIATIDLTKPKSVSHVSEQVSAMSPG